MINSVNWCDIHRSNFPCDKPCPQCFPKEYPHLVICNGDRRYPAGVSGHSCCCFNISAQYLQAAARQIRAEQTEFCLHCGAGIGIHRRDGEGTCPKCDPPKQKCVCAQGVTKCPLHGEQPAVREVCPQCKKAVLGYCAEGQYCTSSECRYVA